ncbi:MAG TPA: hypothetical protein VGR22_08620 [Thermomicrobiales bacterium]|nr:hypothetical protein [Thermomicrobiales bacterium]
MIQLQRNEHLNIDEEMTLLSRRAMLRRSVLGITGVGLTALLAACDDDEDDDEDAAGEGIDPEDAMDSIPLDPDSPAIDEETDVVPEEVIPEDAEEEADT